MLQKNFIKLLKLFSLHDTFAKENLAISAEVKTETLENIGNACFDTILLEKIVFVFGSRTFLLII